MGSSKNKKPIKNISMERNLISKKTKIIGEIQSDGDFRIDGILEGSLTTNGKIIISVDGFINGNADATNADVEGKFLGKLSVANILTIKETANISGEISVGKLSIEPGAAFNGSCSMKGAVKELNKVNDEGKKAEKTA